MKFITTSLFILLFVGCCWANESELEAEPDADPESTLKPKREPEFGLIVQESFVPPGPPNVPTEIVDYNNYVFGSDVVVDKSLFLRDVIEECDKVYIFNLPRQWGKSLNLQMMKYFFEVHVDETGEKIARNLTQAYNLFVKGEVTEDGKTKKLISPPLISKDTDFVEKHLGRCPVIYIDLSRTFTHKTTKEVGISVCKIFNDHKYVLLGMEKAVNSSYTPDNIKKEYQENIKLYHMYWNMDPKLTSDQQIGSVKFLCHMLQKHYKQKPLILIDKYHVPWEDVFYSPRLSGKYKTKFFHFYNAFMEKTFKDNAFFKKGILTGIPFMPAEVRDSAFVYAREFNTLGSKYMEYFGFNQFEVDKLLDLLKIPPETQQEVHKWYKGYHVNHTEFHVYNPLAITEFLTKNKFLRYWIKSGRSDLAKNLLAIESFRNRFRSLLEGNVIQITKERRQFTWEELEQLYRLRLGKNTIEYEDDFADKGFMELFVQGYLTLSEDLKKKVKGSQELHFRFPNFEISGAMKWDLQLYYNEKFGIHYTLKDTIKQEFEKFVNNDETNNPELKNSLTSFLNATKLTNGTSNDRIIRMMLCFLTLDFNTTHKATYEDDDFERPDTWLILNERAIVINVRLKPSAQDVLDEVKAIVLDERTMKSVKVTKYIGINVSDGKSVDIKAEVTKTE